MLVRPQIPHVGEISSPGIDRINLARGKTTRLVLTSLLEEGFNGDVTFTFSGLPPGVSALPAAQVTATERAPTDVGDNAEAVSPPSVTTAFVLLASEEVAVGTEPTMVQLYLPASRQRSSRIEPAGSQHPADGGESTAQGETIGMANRFLGIVPAFSCFR